MHRKNIVWLLMYSYSSVGVILLRSSVHSFALGQQRQLISSRTIITTTPKTTTPKITIIPSSIVVRRTTSTDNTKNIVRSLKSLQLLLSSSPSNINGDTNRNNNNNDKNNSSKDRGKEDKEIRPQTGWNNNLPKKESDFWNGPNLETSKQQRREKNKQEPSILRTGWLHNTQPVTPAPRQQQQNTNENNKMNEASTSSSNTATPVARLRLEQAMKQQQRNHRIVNPPTFHASTIGKRGIVTTEHLLSVPLIRNNTDNDDTKKNERIDVYFTVVEVIETEEYTFFLDSLVRMSNPVQRAKAYVEYAALKNADSMILYLQGGPGFGAPTPVTGLSFGSSSSSWAAKALESTTYKRVVLMDQRGTGKSSPITKQTLELKFPSLFILDEFAMNQSFEEMNASKPEQVTAVQQTSKEVSKYLAQFRADNIVYDAEDIREAMLVLPNLDTQEGQKEAENDLLNVNPIPKPWGCSLGQSYGGFCSMTYLSKVPHPPRVMLLTGGIAPMLANDITTVYKGFWERVKLRNTLYYNMYPDDVRKVTQIVRKLMESDTKLPSGGKLTARRFLQLGLMLGSSPSSFASLHNIINNAFVQVPNQSPITETPVEELLFRRSFLKEMDSASSFDDAPIYYWMHESIYADGSGKSNPTNWAAHRALEQKIQENTDFDYTATTGSPTTSGTTEPRATLFFGEMVFPWMVEDYAELSGYGLKLVTELIAKKDDWSDLYNTERMRSILDSDRTRIAAAIYYDDMYVDFHESIKVTSIGGPLEKCKIYVTNEYQHSGLRDDGANLFTKLYGMALGSNRTPS